MPNPGMAVVGATDLMGQTPVGQQVSGETEEERRKRLAQQRMAQGLPSGASSLGAGYGAAFGTGL